jgi:hypothetical protein
VVYEGEDSLVIWGREEGMSFVVAPLIPGEGLLPIVDLTCKGCKVSELTAIGSYTAVLPLGLSTLSSAA